MKKIFPFLLAGAISVPMLAESIQLIKVSPDGIPGLDEPMLMSMGISPDGTYVCGTLDGKGVFIADRQTGEVKYQICMVDNDDSQLRNVSDTGLGVGIADDGILYSFLTDDISFVNVPSEAKYVLAEDITGSGDCMVGTLVGLPSGGTVGAFSETGGNWIQLPIPKAEEIPGLEKLLQFGTAAKYISSDSKVIVGHVGSFGLPIAWVMNDKGEYELDAFFLKYMKLTVDDLQDPEKPLMAVSAMYYCMSDNGRYVAALGFIPTGNKDETRSVAVLYDMVDKELKVYDDDRLSGEYFSELYPMAICNDGTFIGTVGMPNFQSKGAFIMKAGQTSAELLRDAFPAFDRIFGDSDDLGFNVPSGISADGRYITGFTLYSEDYYDDTTPCYYQSYVIDTLGDPSAVEQVSSGLSVPQSEAVYSIDGRRLGNLSDGFNIVRSSDGTVRKILKK